MNRSDLESSILAGELVVTFPYMSQPERVDCITKILNTGRSSATNSALINRFDRQFRSLPEDCRRDIALTVRAREIKEEHMFLKKNDESRDLFLFNTYGIFVVPGKTTSDPGFTGSVVNAQDTRVIVSAPTWRQASEYLQNYRFGQSTVLLPETITIAGELEVADLDDKDYLQSTVSRNLAKMVELSYLNSEASFVVGTPLFNDLTELPLNVALHIKNGQVLGKVVKYNGVAEERGFFSFPEKRQPYLIQNSSVLICKDLLTLCNSIFFKKKGAEPTVSHPKKYGNRDFFLTEETDELLVISCWGVGAESKIMYGRDQNSVDKLYLHTLLSTVNGVLSREPNLRRIILSDRVPYFANSLSDSLITTKPLSLAAFN